MASQLPIAYQGYSAQGNANRPSNQQNPPPSSYPNIAHVLQHTAAQLNGARPPNNLSTSATPMSAGLSPAYAQSAGFSQAPVRPGLGPNHAQVHSNMGSAPGYNWQHSSKPGQSGYYVPQLGAQLTAGTQPGSTMALPAGVSMASVQSMPASAPNAAGHSVNTTNAAVANAVMRAAVTSGLPMLMPPGYTMPYSVTGVTSMANMVNIANGSNTVNMVGGRGGGGRGGRGRGRGGRPPGPVSKKKKKKNEWDDDDDPEPDVTEPSSSDEFEVDDPTGGGSGEGLSSDEEYHEPKPKAAQFNGRLMAPMGLNGMDALGSPLYSGTPSRTGTPASVGSSRGGKRGKKVGSKKKRGEDDDDDELEEDEEEDGEAGADDKERKPRGYSGGPTLVKQKLPSSIIYHERVNIPFGVRDLQNIEKALAWRHVSPTAHHSHADPDPSSEEPCPPGNQILVKYRFCAYLHCRWLPVSDVERSNLGKGRVKKFMETHYNGWMAWNNEEPFNPNFKIPDRVIDEAMGDNGVIYYLVKWSSLEHSESTWESADLLDDLCPELVAVYNTRKILDPGKQQSLYNRARRPQPGTLQRLVESPEFKDGNKLRAYQLEGVNWLMHCWANRQSSILADEMGLGKTVQSIGLLFELYHKFGIKGPFLVIAPLSTLPNWEREFSTWTDMNVVVFRGRETTRHLIVGTEFYYTNAQGNYVPNIYKFDVLLTTYEMATISAPQLQKIDFAVAVIDEAHRLKSAKSKTGETLKTYRMEHRVLLTGTPLQNNMEELWAILNFLEPSRFRSEQAFIQQYGALKTAEDVVQVQELLKPLMLRRMKDDVEASIPVKEETIIEVTLTPIQKKYYRAILERNFSFLQKGTQRKNIPNLQNAMMELRKCCIHPFLLKGAEETIFAETNAQNPMKQLQAMIDSSGKLVLVDKLLKKLRAGGHKVLIFSQMTRCLDILADYLHGVGWNHERIDGTIRGDVRQAAIDRFQRQNDTFVFLLCTRAGGVGINLTAADTVIIYDSDWNPLNDLQAQARVHRIGQTKPVQIYRLVTSNTYEREMFDRAGLKLGLERAVLQKMDQAGGPPNADGPPDMTAQEIESLLKRGAYGAIMDDEDSQNFVEEDIDQILEKRSTVVKHSFAGEKGSVFSKATFASRGAEEDISLDDPSFWEKIAQKGKLKIENEPEEWKKNLVDGPRNRPPPEKVPNELEAPHSPTQFSEDDDEVWTQPRRKHGGGFQPSVWSQTKKVLLERLIMIWGLSNFHRWLKPLKDRSLNDVKACARECLRFVLACELKPPVDPEIIDDVHAYLDLDETKPMDERGKVLATPAPGEPYYRATKQQIVEFRSFILDSPEDYKDHLRKKARNLLLRVQMIYFLRQKIAPYKGMPMPELKAAPPVPWWTSDDDRDMLIGIVKHGYQKWDEIRNDPELRFARRKYTFKKPSGPSKGEDDDDYDMGTGHDDDAEESRESINGIGMKTESSHPKPEGVSRIETSSSDILDGSDEQPLLWPDPSDFGLRVRKVVNSFQRQFATEAKERAREEAKMSKKARKSEPRVKKGLNDLTKSERQAFQRTLVAYGVPIRHDARGNVVLVNGKEVPDWESFKIVANLSEKSDEAVNLYYEEVLRKCNDVLEKMHAQGSVADGDVDEEKMGGKVDRDIDAFTVDKASRILNRIRLFDRLRREVLRHADLEEILRNVKRHARSGLPQWWEVGEHDTSYLRAVARYGVLRVDLITTDPDLPFKRLLESQRKDMNRKLKDRNGPDEQETEVSVDSNPVKESEWMREMVAFRRIEALVQSVWEHDHPGTVAAGSRGAPQRPEFNRKRKSTRRESPILDDGEPDLDELARLERRRELERDRKRQKRAAERERERREAREAAQGLVREAGEMLRRAKEGETVGGVPGLAGILGFKSGDQQSLLVSERTDPGDESDSSSSSSLTDLEALETAGSYSSYGRSPSSTSLGTVNPPSGDAISPQQYPSTSSSAPPPNTKIRIKLGGGGGKALTPQTTHNSSTTVLVLSNDSSGALPHKRTPPIAATQQQMQQPFRAPSIPYNPVARAPGYNAPLPVLADSQGFSSATGSNISLPLTQSSIGTPSAIFPSSNLTSEGLPSSSLQLREPLRDPAPQLKHSDGPGGFPSSIQSGVPPTGVPPSEQYPMTMLTPSDLPSGMSLRSPVATLAFPNSSGRVPGYAAPGGSAGLVPPSLSHLSHTSPTASVQLPSFGHGDNRAYVPAATTAGGGIMGNTHADFDSTAKAEKRKHSHDDYMSEGHGAELGSVSGGEKRVRGERLDGPGYIVE
ncbi:choline dehydrogenase 6 [Gonapodya sp. JEL0774]|nr:choline dehydrogenase 6 [Gonapodya sp. JEL0774]